MNVPRRPVVFAAAFVLLLAGCRTLPDMQPFADSTGSLTVSIRAAGASVSADTQQLARQYAADANAATDTAAATADAATASAGDLAAATKQLDTAWRGVDGMMQAINTYADSLAGLADAGRSTGKNVQAVGDSVTRLLESVSQAVPGGSEVVKITASLASKLGEMRAADSIFEAMQATQPAVDEVARVVTANLDDLRRINRVVGRDLVVSLEDESRAGFVVTEERRLLKLVSKEHAVILARAVEGTANGVSADDLRELEARAKRLADLVAASRAKLAPVDARIAEIESRTRAQDGLIVAAKLAVTEWAAYHGRLVDGLSRKELPSVASLEQAAADVRELVNLIRNKP